MTGWQIFWLVNALLPIPIALAWRWHVSMRNARMVRDMMAERRAKFGGVMRTPGTDKVEIIERPPK